MASIVDAATLHSRPEWAQIGSRAFTLPASPPGTKETFSGRQHDGCSGSRKRHFEMSPSDAEADIRQPAPDRLRSARNGSALWCLILFLHSRIKAHSVWEVLDAGTGS